MMYLAIMSVVPGVMPNPGTWILPLALNFLSYWYSSPKPFRLIPEAPASAMIAVERSFNEMVVPSMTMS